ncbi:MAG: protein translocase subunit SecF [Rickettsiales bacterium]|jgi:preprotein translocase SecF subunit|nr:protein translocase subunit SecF [Rickettsiales bacterium]
MKLINLIPITVNANFLKFRKVGYFIYAFLIIASVALLATKSLNFGIDFTGGIVVEIKTDESIESLRSRLNKFDPELQTFGEDLVSIRLPAAGDNEEAQMAKLSELRAELGEGVEYRNIEVVGPKVGGELITDGILAFLIAMLAIALYIWVRFDFAFGFTALLGLFADLILTLGFLSLTQIQFSLVSVAAILTMVGYSINDTVVIFDRIRENTKKYKNKPKKEIIDLSMNEMFARTVSTSLTTVIAILAITIWGGAVLQTLAYPLLFGVTAGVFSSIFVAAPLLLNFKD